MPCKLFSQSLKGPALKWYCSLLLGSVGKFKQLNKLFMESYAVHIHYGKTAGDLWAIVQGSSETFRSYIKRFTKTLTEIAHYEYGIALEALKQGLLHKWR